MTKHTNMPAASLTEVESQPVKTLIFKDIECGLKEEDLAYDDSFETVDELRASLPTQVVVTISDDDDGDDDELASACASGTLQSVRAELFDLFCDEIGWMPLSVTVTIPEIGHTEFVSFEDIRREIAACKADFLRDLLLREGNFHEEGNSK